MGVRIDIVDDIYRAEEAASEKGRPHLGASEIGKECERNIYLNFRWVKQSRFEGRMLRLFRRGHIEEPQLISALKKAGFEVWDRNPSTGKQFNVTMSPHFMGSLDGIGKKNGQSYLLEFKTHSHKSFLRLIGLNEKEYKSALPSNFTNGCVRTAKPEHFIQMQVYMGSMKLNKALYVAVNKNDDALYVEEVNFDEKVFRGAKDRADRIIFGWSTPGVNYGLYDKLSPCKFCDYKFFCHGDDTPDRNCRTCKFSSPEKDGTWSCSKNMEEIDYNKQQEGCEQYEVFNF